MKKCALLVVAFIVSVSLCACACDNMTPTTNPTNNTTTNPTDTIPSETMIIPTPETNIPDPSVEPGDNNLLPDGTTGDNITRQTGTDMK